MDVSEKKDLTDIKASSSYIIKDITSDRAHQIFSAKIKDKHKGLFITRTNPDQIRRKHNISSDIMWLASEKTSSENAVCSMQALKSKVNVFIKTNKKSIVMLDRLDYLINMHGFNEVLKFIYSVNDKVVSNSSIFMVNINPNTLSSQELSLLSQELTELYDARKVLDDELPDDLDEILDFVRNSEKASFKDISKEFNITKTTTRKRISSLIEKGLVDVKKNGRKKIVKITELGNSKQQ